MAGSTDTSDFLIRRARLGGLTTRSRHNPIDYTAKARANGPGSATYWEIEVDPELLLPPHERAKRASAAKRAHFTRLSIKAAAARRLKAGRS